MSEILEKIKILLISRIIQAGEAQRDVFECLGRVDIQADKVRIEFEHADVVGHIEVGEASADLHYTKPYTNTLTFHVNYSTQANYHSDYGVMALIVDTKKIQRLSDRVILHYDLLQANFKIGEYQIELVYKEGNN